MTSTEREGQRRSGRQRAAVSSLLDRGEGFRSAQEIYAELRAQGNAIGLATVYRALQTMVQDGELDVIRARADGEAVYRRCGPRHHHHLVCRTCGRTVEVEGLAVERWSRQVATEHGFDDVSHEIDLFGTCGGCARAESR